MRNPRAHLPVLLAAIALAVAPPSVAKAPAQKPAEMEMDLLEVTVPQLQRLYAQHKYTVTEVVRWHLDRIRRYDGVYRAVETVFESEALAAAAREDAEAAGNESARGPLWGVPVVIKANTSIAGTVTTDGWEGYGGLKAKGYPHRVTVLLTSKRSAVEVLPRVHLVASLLKRWLLGTHQGAVSFTHLEYYLDEFTFRFNRRTSRSRGKLFQRLLEQAVAVEPAPYKTLVGGGETWWNSTRQIRQLLESTK